MNAALVLLDAQRDFFARPGLVPKPAVFIDRAARLLEECRALGAAVFHVHTQLRADGADRMPHWKQMDVRCCVAGTPGASPPPSLRPVDGEQVFVKQFFSAFGNLSFDAALRQHDVRTLIVAGLYLHGCVRSTVLDAYERGYEVWIADDAVGTTEADQAELARIYLDGRAATFLDTPALAARLRPTCTGDRDPAKDVLLPVAHIAGCPVTRTHQASLERRNPSNWGQVLAHVPRAGQAEVDQAARAAAESQRRWAHVAPVQRRALLQNWAQLLGGRADQLADLLAVEIGKPLAEGRDEIRRALALARTAADVMLNASGQRSLGNPPVQLGSRPHGVIGLITTWNNPLAIPVGKIAPALAYGNGVVWKPASEAPRTALLLLQSLMDAGLPAGLVNLVFGEADTARRLIDAAEISAVSLTGSMETGRAVAVRCLRLNKPLQAELGGNNAAIVLRDFDFKAHARALGLSAFSFGGQRCTAIRRFIVERSIVNEFRHTLVSAAQSLRLGEPRVAGTEIGPLISAMHRQCVMEVLEQASAEGGRILCGGTTPAELEHGCWLAPAVVDGVGPSSRIVQEETMGPVAVILPADGLDEAIAMANGVQQGLVAALHTEDPSSRRRFAEAVQAGILKFAMGPLDVHPEAPFGGWKGSGLGPPEHGVWDTQFYARPQAIYGWPTESD